MRRDLMLAALLLPLSGCYVAPAGPAYVQPGYPAPAGYYAQPGYPPAGYDPNAYAYPGYSDNDGAPSLFVDGAAVPLVMFGGGWGYYDGRHQWHRAPDSVARHLDQEHAGGAPFHPGGGGFHPGGGDFHPDHGNPGGGFHPNGGNPGGGGFHGIAPQQSGPPGRPSPNPAAFQGRPPPPPQFHGDQPRGHECPPGQHC